jgi:hypothetical protein
MINLKSHKLRSQVLPQQAWTASLEKQTQNLQINLTLTSNPFFSN